MTTRREAALQALAARLAAIPGVAVRRNDDKPATVPPGGLIILHDGDPGMPEVSLSPPRYWWEHEAEAQVIVQKAPQTARTAAMDDLLAAIGAALAADRTLGGAVSHCEPGAPRPDEVAVDGATPIRGAALTIVLSYDTSDPLA